ncbi:MAG: 4'-phosphopantetheinyl transferase superfamily protein [Pseudomonadota bacterium]|jgi:4'-phosphopantetheinyl transferase|nr:MAG: 4'-phosphopantetheinyl transferase [Pseudomonadota bacterium]
MAGAWMRWHLSVARHAPPCGALLLFPLDVPDAERHALAALLSEEERARAARFVFPELGHRFTVAHGRLRQVLAPLVGVDPARLAFRSAEHGKPELAGDAGRSGVQFNLSHSGAWAVIGWAMGRAIGVDIEVWRPMSDEEALVRRYFSAAENAAWEALPPAERSAAFFRCWTRKEAYIKAVGRGLGLPLDSFDVSLDPVDVRLLRPSALCEDGRCWSLAAAEGPPRTSIAVVLESDSLFLLPDVP